MKNSLQNDTGLRATQPTNYPGEGNNKGISTSGATSAPQSKLLAGKLVAFKNAEDPGLKTLVSYDADVSNP